MWKKTETDEVAQPEYTPKSTVGQLKERAVLGPSIKVKGDLTGDEDLMVQGRIEGKIEVRNHSVTIGSNGRVSADVYAKVISVEGEVHGNLYGEEKIVVRKTGRVKGNLVAPRVGLEDGASFKGSIDMDSGRLPKKPAGVEVSEEKKSSSTDAAKSPQKVPLGLSSESPSSRGK